MSVSPVEWKIPINQLIKQNILGKDTMLFAANEAARLMDKFVPRDEGHLKDNYQIISGETTAEVHYTQPYAATMYYGIRRGKPINIRSGPGAPNPLASKEWDRAAMAAGGKEKLIAAVSEYIQRKRGG